MDTQCSGKCEVPHEHKVVLFTEATAGNRKDKQEFAEQRVKLGAAGIMGRDVHSWDMGKSCSGEWGMVESNKGQTTLAGLEALGGRTFSKSGGARTGSQAGAQRGLICSSLASSMALDNVLLLFFFSSVPG
ncbi:hypothetical protein H8959_018470 [Pygathrix nigripes]